MSDERDAINAELEIILERFSQSWKRPQDQLPLWLYTALQDYGVACCKRGIKLAYLKKTLKPSTRGPWDDDETPLEIQFDDDGR